MKRLSFILPICAIVFAVGGAFAMKSANEAQQVEVWYRQNANNTGACLSTDLIPCNAVSGIDCVMEVPELEQNRTIFQNSDCTNPYQRSNPNP